MTALYSVPIRALISRIKRYAKASGRTVKAVSREIFDDTRTVDALSSGNRNIWVSRLERASDRLFKLEKSQRKNRNENHHRRGKNG